MKIFYLKWRRLFSPEQVKQKSMSFTMFGIKWLLKNIRREKILVWKTIYLMIPKMIFSIKKRLKKTKERMGGRWMKSEISLRKLAGCLLSCMVLEFFIVVELMCYLSSLWVVQKIDI